MGENQAQNGTLQGTTIAPQSDQKPLFGQKMGGEGQTSSKPQITEAQKIKDLTEMLQRLQAEFENYQKRSSKQNEDYKLYANAKLTEEILPVLDALEAGMQHDKNLAVIYEQLAGVLKKNGIHKIKAGRGMRFDHDKMECLLSEKILGQKDGTIVNVLISGYEMNGKILRPSKVSVNVLSLTENKSEKNENVAKIQAVGAQNENKKEEIKPPESKGKENVTKIDWQVQKMESD